MYSTRSTWKVEWVNERMSDNEGSFFEVSSTIAYMWIKAKINKLGVRAIALHGMYKSWSGIVQGNSPIKIWEPASAGNPYPCSKSNIYKYVITNITLTFPFMDSRSSCFSEMVRMLICKANINVIIQMLVVLWAYEWIWQSHLQLNMLHCRILWV